MNWIGELFMEQSVIQAIVVISFVASLGLLLNRLSLGGITLGVAFVFFIGIIAGHLGLSINRDMLLYAESFGLIIFIYALGLQVGPAFFGSFRRGGISLNLYALLIVLSGSIIALLFHWGLGISLPNMMGILSGAVTNTPSLAASQQTLKHLNIDIDPALGCAVAYPLGVVGVILGVAFIIRFTKSWKCNNKDKEDNKKPTFIVEFAITNPNISNRTIGEISELTKLHFIITRIWRDGIISIPKRNSVLIEGDRILVIINENDLDSLEVLFGEKENVDWNRENIDWDSIDKTLVSQTMIITSSKINGKKLGQLNLRSIYGVNITRIYRAGVEILPVSDLVLQFGDKLVVLGDNKALVKISELIGNKYKELNEPNMVAIFVGMFIGLLIGSIPFAIPGMSLPLKLGIAGGPMIVGILIGAFGPRFRVVTYTTRGANLMLQRLGLTLYLACLGLDSGRDFFEIVFRQEGLIWMGAGFIITVLPVLTITPLLIKFTKMDIGSLLGMSCGSMCNPMALNYVDSQIDNNKPSVAYATVYPLTMFLRVILAQVILILFH